MKKVTACDKKINFFVFFHSSQNRIALGIPTYEGKRNMKKNTALFKIDMVSKLISRTPWRDRIVHRNYLLPNIFLTLSGKRIDSYNRE